MTEKAAGWRPSPPSIASFRGSLDAPGLAHITWRMDFDVRPNRVPNERRAGEHSPIIALDPGSDALRCGVQKGKIADLIFNGLFENAFAESAGNGLDGI